MKSLCVRDVIDGLPLSRFWRLYFFWKKLILKARYGTLWSFLTYGYQKSTLSKIGSKNISIRFCKTYNGILKACLALKPDGGEK